MLGDYIIPRIISEFEYSIISIVIIYIIFYFYHVDSADNPHLPNEHVFIPLLYYYIYIDFRVGIYTESIFFNMF